MKAERIYLAGPMRGLPDFNFPAFHQMAWKLRRIGWEVFNPAENDEKQYGAGVMKSATGDEAEVEKTVGFNLRLALKQDLSWIADNATAIVLMPGWRKSKGAIAEFALARALNLEVWLVSPGMNQIVQYR